MLLIKKVSFILLFLSFCFSQGRMNAFGIGHFYHYQGLNNAMDGITELTPSFQSDVSLSNPSTWHNLKFAYLSLAYSGNENSEKTSSLSNGYSSLSNAIWVVPIKSRSSIGFSLSPYLDQRINLIDQDTLSFEAYDSTYAYARSFDRSGGILSFKVSTSYKFNDRLSLGINYNVLFGSSRQNESISFGGNPVVQSSRIKYNGITNDVYIGLSLLKDLRFYAKYTFSMKPLEAAIEKKHLFDDVNGIGYHDYIPPYYDFPFPDSINASPELRVSNLHDPTGFKLGVHKFLMDRTAFSMEVGRMKDNANNENPFLQFPMPNWINSTNSLKVSLLHYPGNFSLRFIDKLNFKGGVTYYEHLLKFDDEITELGFSIGVGFKFKPIGNQIDLSYYFGNREYSNISGKEFIQQIQIGISLADLWFVKRRQK